MFSTRNLIKVAAVCGIATVSMGFAVKFKISGNITKTEYYQEALKTLHAHPGAVYLLGEPIKEKSIDLSNTITKNFTNESTAYYEVPVKGTKKQGVLYFWAAKHESEKVYKLGRIELSLDDEPNKRLLVKNI